MCENKSGLRWVVNPQHLPRACRLRHGQARATSAPPGSTAGNPQLLARGSELRGQGTPAVAASLKQILPKSMKFHRTVFILSSHPVLPHTSAFAGRRLAPRSLTLNYRPSCAVICFLSMLSPHRRELA